MALSFKTKKPSDPLTLGCYIQPLTHKKSDYDLKDFKSGIPKTRPPCKNPDYANEPRTYGIKVVSDNPISFADFWNLFPREVKDSKKGASFNFRQISPILNCLTFCWSPPKHKRFTFQEPR